MTATAAPNWPQELNEAVPPIPAGTTKFDQLSWLQREFPQTRDPLPLGERPPWVRTRDAQECRALRTNTNPKAPFKFWRRQWRQLARSAPLIREPAGDRSDLCRLDIVGHCLEPIIPVGTRCWFDPSVRAQHGDFVLFEMDPELIEYLSNDPIALRENGGPPKTNVMIKRLMWMDDWYLVAKDSGGPILPKAPHRHRVLSVLRHFEIDGGRGDSPKAQAAYMTILPRNSDNDLGESSGQVDTDRIADDSVTELYQVAAGSLSGFSGHTLYHDLTVLEDAGGNSITSGPTTLLLPRMTHNATAVVTGTFIGSKGAAGTVSVRPYLFNADTDTESVGAEYPLSTSDRAFTVHHQFDLTAGTQYRIGIASKSSAAGNQESYTGPVVTQIQVVKK